MVEKERKRGGLRWWIRHAYRFKVIKKRMRKSEREKQQQQQQDVGEQQWSSDRVRVGSNGEG